MQNCYNTGKIPRELVHDQSERLTTKHIQTLSFLQDIGKENKQLKAKVEDLENQLGQCAELHTLAESSQDRIKQLQAEWLARSDETQQILVQKQRIELLQKEDEKLNAEEAWAQEKKALLEEIERLKKEIYMLRAELQNVQQGKNLSQALQERLVALEKEAVELRDEKVHLEHIRDNQTEEITRLSHVSQRNLDLIEEVKEVTQKNKELLFKIDRLQKELEEPARQEHEDVMTTLRNKLAKLHKEKSHFEEKESEYEKQVNEFKDENVKLRRALNDSERMRAEMHEKMESLVSELNMLRRQGIHSGRDKQHFKDFVQLKRDVGVLRAENDELRTRLKLATGNGKSGNLPSLKPSGNQGNGGRERKGKSEGHGAMQWKGGV